MVCKDSSRKRAISEFDHFILTPEKFYAQIGSLEKRLRGESVAGGAAICAKANKHLIQG